MKRRLRGLLALVLALCLGLTMTVSAVSAAEYYFDDKGNGWQLYRYDGSVDDDDTPAGTPLIVNSEDKIYATKSGADKQGDRSFIQVDGKGDAVYNSPEDSLWTLTTLQDKSNVTITNHEGKDFFAYTGGDQYFKVRGSYRLTVGDTDKYNINGDSDTILNTITLTPYSPPPPIRYTIKYVMEPDSETSAYSDSFTAGTAGSAGNIASAEELGFAKEGFKAKPQWLLPDGTEVETGASIDDVFSQLQDNAESSGYRQREIELTAQWEDIRYTVHYEANGGTGLMEDQIFTVDQEGVLSLNAFTYEGYEFSGWNTAADGTGTAYADGATVINLAKGGETITLYARWTEIPKEPANDGAAGGREDQDDRDDRKDRDKDAQGRDETTGEQTYDHSAATGDDTDVLLWTFLAMIAMLAAAGILASSRKSES